MTKSFEQMSEWERKSYLDGIEQEKKVARLLEAAGFENVRKGTREQDIYFDMDLFAEKDGKTVSFSVKANTPKYFENDFCFELGVHYLDNPDRFVPSWYFTGKADFYAIYKRHYSGGGELYLISKKELVKHIASRGWKKECIQRADVASNQRKYKNISKTCLGLLDKTRHMNTLVHLIADDIGNV